MVKSFRTPSVERGEFADPPIRHFKLVTLDFLGDRAIGKVMFQQVNMPDREAHFSCKVLPNERPQLAEGAIIDFIAEEIFSALYAVVDCESLLVSFHTLLSEELVDFCVSVRRL